MHNPPHPVEFIIQVYPEPHNLSCCEPAGKLGVAASTAYPFLPVRSVSALKWHYAFPRLFAALRRVGLLSSITMISGMPNM